MWLEDGLEKLAELIDMGDWTLIDDVCLETCHGHMVEWDCPTCPECGAPNPIMEAGFI